MEEPTFFPGKHPAIKKPKNILETAYIWAI